MLASNPNLISEPIVVPDTRFLVIGCGSIGKRHLTNLKRLGVTQISAFDVRTDRRREIEERFDVPTFDNLDNAFKAGAGAALVCTPTRLHLEHALLAVSAGCHLFIEKPVAEELEGLDRLSAEIAHRNLSTLVGCNFRFHPGLRRIKSLLTEQAIGTVVSARAQFGQYLPDWHPWEDYRQGYSAQRCLGGGVVLDRIHELDYIRWLLGEITEVYALMGHLSHLEVDVEDTAEILLRFVSGAYGSVHLDYVRRTYDCSLEIIGDCGTIQWRYQDHSVHWYCAQEEVWHVVQTPKYDGNDMYIAELAHFLRVLRGEEASQQNLAEATRVLAIALAAKQSARESRMVTL